MLKTIRAFTLIEMTVVIIIILILTAISIPMMSKGSSHHEVKFNAHSIQSLLMNAASLAKSAGKVYIIDGDASSSNYIYDPNDATKELYRFSILRIYSALYDGTNIIYSFAGETLEIPFTLGTYIDSDMSTGEKDYIYFKPDGTMSSSAEKLFVCPEKNNNLYYEINLGKVSGNVEIKSYKD